MGENRDVWPQSKRLIQVPITCETGPGKFTYYKEDMHVDVMPIFDGIYTRYTYMAVVGIL